MENFNTIYSNNHRFVLSFVSRKTNDLEVAEELTNDIFMKVYNNLSKFDAAKSAMRTWIMNITNNTVIDYYRKKKLETISLYATDSEDNEINFGMDVASTVNPHKEMVTSETVERIQNAILNLPKPYGKIAHMSINLEFSYEEIADQLNIPLGTVKGQLSRAKKKLSRKLVNA